MTSHRCQHNLTFSTIKNGARKKEYIRQYLVLFSSKQVLLMHTELFMRRMKIL